MPKTLTDSVRELEKTVETQAQSIAFVAASSLKVADTLEELKVSSKSSFRATVREAELTGRRIDGVTTQVERLLAAQGDVQAAQAKITTDSAVLRQRQDDHVKRFERYEISVETLLKDVAALKTTNGDLQKRVEFWESRIWGAGLAVVGALVSAVATLVYAILRK